jgi:DNA-3-methyladenine glycosylase I
LLERVIEAARGEGCRLVWMIATNDNLSAPRFYQRRGFEMVGVRRGAVERARLRKPEIPLVGEHGIPVRDEIEPERLLWREPPRSLENG